MTFRCFYIIYQTFLFYSVLVSLLVVILASMALDQIAHTTIGTFKNGDRNKRAGVYGTRGEYVKHSI